VHGASGHREGQPGILGSWVHTSERPAGGMSEGQQGLHQRDDRGRTDGMGGLWAPVGCLEN